MSGDIPAGTRVAVGHTLHPTLDPSCCGQMMRNVKDGIFECRSCDCYMITARRTVEKIRDCGAHR